MLVLNLFVDAIFSRFSRNSVRIQFKIAIKVKVFFVR